MPVRFEWVINAAAPFPQGAFGELGSDAAQNCRAFESAERHAALIGASETFQFGRVDLLQASIWRGLSPRLTILGLLEENPPPRLVEPVKLSVIQSVRMLFFREDFEPRTPSKTQEVLEWRVTALSLSTDR